MNIVHKENLQHISKLCRMHHTTSHDISPPRHPHLSTTTTSHTTPHSPTLHHKPTQHSTMHLRSPPHHATEHQSKHTTPHHIAYLTSLPVSVTICALAVLASSMLRHTRCSTAPLRASCRAVLRPSPLLPPVHSWEK